MHIFPGHTAVQPISFEAWFSAYPLSEAMPADRARSDWDRLTPADQRRAWNALPGYCAWLKPQPANYIPLHAHHFLALRRFEAFDEPPAGYVSPQHSRACSFLNHKPTAGQETRQSPRSGQGGPDPVEHFPMPNGGSK